MLHTLTRTQPLPISMDEAWEYFANPANLCRITPAWLDFRITCGEPQPMYAGQIITYTVRPLPRFTVTWVTEITHVRKPDFFVDEQRLGPYRFWHHQHSFIEQNGSVLMQDTVNYALPFGVLGDMVNALFVRPRLRAIFDFRRQTLERLFS